MSSAKRKSSPAFPRQGLMVAFKDPLTIKIADFLWQIGIDVLPEELTGETFLPGILVDKGRLLVDEAKLAHPGDILHEAGHLAVAPGSLRSGLSGEVILPGVNLDALEAQAMAWSYAATLHLGLDPEVVFHEGGYKGESKGLLFNFQMGAYIGVSGLQDLGMTVAGDPAQETVLPYPHMTKWLRD